MTVKMIANMYQIRNIWLITALATIGGLIQGFDVSSLSAIIGTEQVCVMFGIRVTPLLTQYIVQNLLS